MRPAVVLSSLSPRALQASELSQMPLQISRFGLSWVREFARDLTLARRVFAALTAGTFSYLLSALACWTCAFLSLNVDHDEYLPVY